MVASYTFANKFYGKMSVGFMLKPTKRPCVPLKINRY